MTKHRFYLPPDQWDMETPALEGDEAHHCRDVMRCGTGDRLLVFDGAGREMEAEILSVSRRAVELAVISRRITAPLPARITLGQAIPKGKNMELIIQKATELGVAEIVPLLTENTVVQLKSGEREKKREKWQRVAVEACKQCGQNWLPRVAEPQAIGDFIASVRDECRIVAAIDPESLTLREILAQWDAEHPSRPEAATLLIGPEGDFTAAEVATARAADFRPLSLGPIILRAETAAIYAVSVLVYELMGR